MQVILHEQGKKHMRTLKNWTIVCKSIKHGQRGLLNYHRYLNDQQRHDNQIINNITPISGLEYLLRKHQDFELQQKLKNKGGRPSNPGWSAMCSYPFDLNEKEFKELKTKVLKEFYKYVSDVNKLKLTDKMIEEQIASSIAIIHSGDNINNHLHLILNKVFLKKPFIGKPELVSIDLTKKKYSHMLKVINDKWCIQLFQKSTVDYNIKTDAAPQKRRRSGISITREKLAASTKRVADLEERVELAEMDLKDREAILQAGIDRQMSRQAELLSLEGATQAARERNQNDLAELERNSKRLGTDMNEFKDEKNRILKLDRELKVTEKRINTYIHGNLTKHIEKAAKFMEKGQTDKYYKQMALIDKTMKYGETIEVLSKNNVQSRSIMGKIMK